MVDETGMGRGQRKEIKHHLPGDKIDEMLREAEDDQVETDRQVAAAYLLPYVQKWYDGGEHGGLSAETIVHAIRAVRLLALHQEEIGSEHYEAVRNTVISAVAYGVTQQNWHK